MIKILTCFLVSCLLFHSHHHLSMFRSQFTRATPTNTQLAFGYFEHNEVPTYTPSAGDIISAQENSILGEHLFPAKNYGGGLFFEFIPPTLRTHYDVVDMTFNLPSFRIRAIAFEKSGEYVIEFGWIPILVVANTSYYLEPIVVSTIPVKIPEVGITIVKNNQPITKQIQFSQPIGIIPSVTINALAIPFIRFSKVITANPLATFQIQFEEPRIFGVSVATATLLYEEKIIPKLRPLHYHA